MTNTIADSRRTREAEHRWRWVVLAASFSTSLINASLNYHVGVLNVAVSDTFDPNPLILSWLMAIYASMFALAAPIGSAVINVSTCRTCVLLSGLVSFVGLLTSSFVTCAEWLFLTLTVAGLGQSLAQVGGSMVLAYYFPTKMALASGICFSGAGLGSFVHPALLQLLLEEYNLRGALMILAAVSLQTCALGLLMKPTVAECKRSEEKHNSKESPTCFTAAKIAVANHLEIAKNSRFLQLLVSVFCFAFAFQAVVIYLPEFLINLKDYTALEAASVASCIGIGTVCSRVLVGFAATDSNIGQSLMYVGMNFVSCLVCVAADVVMQYQAGAYIVAVALGVYASASQALLLPLTIGVLGQDRSASGFGIVLMVLGGGCLVGPPICEGNLFSAAVTLKKFGYGFLFRLSGTLFLIAAIVSTGTYQDKGETPCSDLADEQPVDSPDDALFGSQGFEIIVPESVAEADEETNLNQSFTEKLAD